MIALLVAAAAVRVADLPDWWLNPDEGIYYSVLTRSDFSGFWQEVVANAHPPLYYLLLRAFSLVTWDFYWFRLFSVLCGVVAVWGAWAAGRELALRDGQSVGQPTVGQGTDPDRGVDLPAAVAGLLGALILALAPGLVALSQVMRPYTLQLALLIWALHFWLRFIRDSSARDLGGYLTLLCLALLTHYSSVLALGVFVAASAAVAWVERPDRPEVGRLAWGHLLPVALVAALYLVHMRDLAGSALADQALEGWLDPYMIDGPGDAWLAFLGFQHLLAHPWLRGPMALFLLAALGLAILRRRRTVWVLAGGALAVALVAAGLGLYPFGSTRHSVWALTFTVPAVGWLGGVLVSWSRRAHGLPRAVPTLLAALVLALGGPVGSALGMDRAPWAPTDRVLRRADVARMLEILEPTSEPELVLMSAQTFYLLIPFWAAHREQAAYSADSTAFHFPYGRRQVVVSTAWDFALSAPTDGMNESAPPGDLGAFLETTRRTFPLVAPTERERAVILVGGWRPPFVDRLGAASSGHPFIHSVLNVPGLYAFDVDPEEMMEVLDSLRAGAGR